MSSVLGAGWGLGTVFGNENDLMDELCPRTDKPFFVRFFYGGAHKRLPHSVLLPGGDGHSHRKHDGCKYHHNKGVEERPFHIVVDHGVP